MSRIVLLTEEQPAVCLAITSVYKIGLSAWFGI